MNKARHKMRNNREKNPIIVSLEQISITPKEKPRKDNAINMGIILSISRINCSAYLFSTHRRQGRPALTGWSK